MFEEVCEEEYNEYLQEYPGTTLLTRTLGDRKETHRDSITGAVVATGNQETYLYHIKKDPAPTGDDFDKFKELRTAMARYDPDKAFWKEIIHHNTHRDFLAMEAEFTSVENNLWISDPCNSSRRKLVEKRLEFLVLWVLHTQGVK